MASDLPDPQTATSPWVSSSGIPAHPNAARGGGGQGRFKGATSLGTEGNDADPIPHPLSPRGRNRALSDQEIADLEAKGVPMDTGVKIIEMGTAPQPPPATLPRTFHVKRAVPGKEDIDVEVEVLADGVATGLGSRELGDCKLDPANVVGTPPEAITDDPAKPVAQQKVIRLDGVLTIKGKVTIQRKYGASIKPTATSAYGRGTTDADKKAGNTSIGFHESCHETDYVNWLKTKPLPSFTGKVGMTGTQYQAAQQAFSDALDKYFEDASKNSETLTDEVGNPTLTQFKAAQNP